MAKAKHRYYAKWRITALTVGFFTIMFAAPALAQCPSYIYWVDEHSGNAYSSIRRGDLCTNTTENLINRNSPEGIALDLTNNHIYWIQRGGHAGIRGIGRMDLDGDNIIGNLVTPIDDGYGIALDLTNNHIYWSTTDQIGRADLDGNNRMTPIPSASGVIVNGREIALDLTNNHIYWSTTSQIGRADLDGNNPVTLIPGNVDGWGIALDLTNNHIYWADQTNDTIHRTDKDIINIQTVNIPGGVDTPSDVALDLVNNHIYWVEWSATYGAPIRRANLDGTDPVDLITIPQAFGREIALQITSFSSSSSLSGDDKETRRVPFRSKWLLLALMAALGGWQVLLRGKAW